MPGKKETFDVEFSIPDAINKKNVRAHIPLIASNLQLSCEVIKLRLLKEKGTYTQEEVHRFAFNSFGSWMNILSRCFD